MQLLVLDGGVGRLGTIEQSVAGANQVLVLQRVPQPAVGLGDECPDARSRDGQAAAAPPTAESSSGSMPRANSRSSSSSIPGWPSAAFSSVFTAKAEMWPS